MSFWSVCWLYNFHVFSTSSVQVVKTPVIQMQVIFSFLAFCFNCLYPCFANILQSLLITRAVAVWATLKDTRVRFPIHNSCEAAEVMVTIILPAYIFLNVMVMIAMNTIITHFYFNWLVQIQKKLLLIKIVKQYQIYCRSYILLSKNTTFCL